MDAKILLILCWMTQKANLLAVSCALPVNPFERSSVVTPHDPISSQCYEGTCLNKTCVCNRGWDGNMCDQCEGRILLTNTSGFIIDGPGNYSQSRRCSWLVQSPMNSTIRLQIHEFASECGWDYLYVYDGDSAFSPLLAAFNGLKYTAVNKDRYQPELIATSGAAYLFFFSDMALNMSGFNISYSMDQCKYNCSNYGSCSDGLCKCDETRFGSTCSYVQLSNYNTSEKFQHCLKFNESTTCFDNLWTVSEIPSNAARSSYDLATIKDSLLIFGGMQFGTEANDNALVTFNTSYNKWLSNVNSSSTYMPLKRYGHTLVIWKDKLIMYGGKLLLNETTVDHLWEYNLNKSVWKQVSFTAEFNLTLNSKHSLLALSGHTANVVKFANGTMIMVVLFGFHPSITFSNSVYEYDPLTKLWRKPRLAGDSVQGMVGHSSVYDSDNNLIFIHGGHHEKNGNIALSSETLMYNPLKRYFCFLKSSKVPRYLHSASFMNGVMYVYGGTTLNDANKERISHCFLSDFMAYHVACERWISLPAPQVAIHPRRYGHKSTIMKSSNLNAKLYIIGGYDGTIIEEMLIYEPPSCELFSANESLCLGSFGYGVTCFWNGLSCLSVSSSVINETVCLQLMSNKYVQCDVTAGNFSNCFSNDFDCKLCRKNCNGSVQSCNAGLCKDSQELLCHSLTNCEQCQVSQGCIWENNDCIKRLRNTTDLPTCDEENTCSFHSSCENCTKSSACIWCLNLEKCINADSYALQFPYGQCEQWAHKQCIDVNCIAHETCQECQKYTKCGWCDDGSGTGKGSCTEGGSSGPVSVNNFTNVYEQDISYCSQQNWYFTSCPKCQCNGHSFCDKSNICINCTNHTTGSHCESCDGGFFGNALNGGDCSQCNCNGKARFCDSVSGSCHCFTKGVTGTSCNTCDTKNQYVGNASKNGTCFYPLDANYLYTFTFNYVEDKYISAINFQNHPWRGQDIELSFDSQQQSHIKLTVVSYANGVEKDETLAELWNKTSLKYDFRQNSFEFGDENLNATIRIFVSNFILPCWIQVSLLQTNTLLLKMLLILFSSFLGILLLAALVWKLKLVYSRRQQRANQVVHMKKMAARPFANVNLLCDESHLSAQQELITASNDICEGCCDYPTVLCSETCSNNQVSVVSVFLWLPSNTSKYAELDSTVANENNHNNCTSGYTLLRKTPPDGQCALAIGTVLSTGKCPKLQESLLSLNQNTRKLVDDRNKLHQVVLQPPNNQGGNRTYTVSDEVDYVTSNSTCV